MLILHPNFDKIAGLPTFMLRTSFSTKSSNSTLKMLGINNNEIIKVGSKADEMVRNLFKSKKLKKDKLKNLIYVSNIGATRKLMFLIFSDKKTFNYLR